MSTHYRPLSPIRFTAIFGGSLERLGITETTGEDTSPSRRRLTDGINFLWVQEGPTGFTGHFTRYFPNGVPDQILAAVSEVFDTTIVSEHQPEYWGFDSQEKWDDYMQKQWEKEAAEFYVEMIKHVRDEPNDLRDGSNGMYWAEIGKSLIADEPSLASPHKERELLDAIWERERGSQDGNDEAVTEDEDYFFDLERASQILFRSSF